MKVYCLRIFLCLLAIMITCSVTYASASEIISRADTEFNSATATLKSSKQVTFKSVTYDIHNQLSVTACWLERKNNDGSWSYVRALTPPSTVFTNTCAYSATVDYAAYIGTGTFRVWATFDADGHSISRCSNERTY